MNIILTTNCNNHCPYCFEAGNETGTEFTKENIVKLIDWFKVDNPNSGISLMGGEPTIYSEFPWVLNYCADELPGRNICVITNLLGPDSAIEAMAARRDTACLVNTNYDKDKEETFIKHMKMLRTHTMNFSITFSPNKRLNRMYVDRVVWLQEKLPFLTSIRIGMATPNPHQVIKGIYNYESDLMYLFNQCKGTRITRFYFDCAMNLCQLSMEFIKFIHNYVNIDGKNTSLVCKGSCIDIFPDFTSKYCMSSREPFYIDNIFKFNSLAELNSHYVNLDKEYVIKNKICTSCELFNNGCNPCHAFDQSLLEGEKS